MGSEKEDNNDAANAANAEIFKAKTTPKVVRVLTVLAYILCVSMAAILLSGYYIFMWEERPHIGALSLKQSMSNDSMMAGSQNGGNGRNTTNKLEMNITTARDTPNTPLNNYTAFGIEFLENKKSQVHIIMSYNKSNGIKLTKCDSKQWKTASTVIDATSVKFAGEEAKDRLYEPKHKKKLVRVLTVVAYVFFVSLAAIMLSLYYLFLWNGDHRIQSKLMIGRHQTFNNKCDNYEEILREIKLLRDHDSMRHLQLVTSPTSQPTPTPTPAPALLLSTTPPTILPRSTTNWYTKELSYLENLPKKNFLRKLLKGYYNDVLK